MYESIFKYRKIAARQDSIKDCFRFSFRFHPDCRTDWTLAKLRDPEIICFQSRILRFFEYRGADSRSSASSSRSEVNKFVGPSRPEWS